jgi:hypothetical protein
MQQNKQRRHDNQCNVCGEVFVVESLARCCEMKHDGVVFVRRESQMPRTKKPELTVVENDNSEAAA